MIPHGYGLHPRRVLLTHMKRNYTLIWYYTNGEEALHANLTQSGNVWFDQENVVYTSPENWIADVKSRYISENVPTVKCFCEEVSKPMEIML